MVTSGRLYSQNLAEYIGISLLKRHFGNQFAAFWLDIIDYLRCLHPSDSFVLGVGPITGLLGYWKRL